MFHGYYDARRPLLHPCNIKGKTLSSSGYKSQRMYCTEKGERERGEEEKTGGKNGTEREKRKKATRQKEKEQREESVKKTEAEGEDAIENRKKNRGRGECKEERNRGRKSIRK
jgi:hypothetical protein